MDCVSGVLRFQCPAVARMAEKETRYTFDRVVRMLLTVGTIAVVVSVAMLPGETAGTRPRMRQIISTFRFVAPCWERT